MVKQTRIRIVTTVGGSQTFYPQVKGWIFWSALQYFDEWNGYTDIRCNSLEEAQKHIDEYIQDVQERAAQKLASKTLSITYVKYP